MSDDHDDLDGLPNPAREHLRRVEAERDQARQEAAAAEALRREVAFLKAGIDPEDKRMAYFVKGYDGALDPEAIKATALETGFLAPPTTTVPPAQQDAIGRIAATAAGSSGAPTPSWDEKIKAATSRDEVLRLAAQARKEAGI